jgi:outer membrane lipoprotein-sorting protein
VRPRSRGLRPRLLALLPIFAALVSLSPISSVARGDDSPLDAFVTKVKKGMKDVKTTRGRFTQTRRLAAFDDAVVSTGSFAIERPSKIRWEIEKPFRSILVITGDKGARWNEHRKAVERFALAEKPGIDVAVKQMFTWYSGDFEDVKATFEPTVESDGRTVSLVPKNEKVRDVMARIAIRFAPDFATIESIAIEEKGGDRTDIVFSSVALNEALDPKTFEIAEK